MLLGLWTGYMTLLYMRIKKSGFTKWFLRSQSLRFPNSISSAHEYSDLKIYAPVFYPLTSGKW